MRKIIGYLLLFLSGLLIFDRLFSLTNFAFNQFGFWGGLLNFSLLPLTFFIYPILRIFVANDSSDIIYVIIISLLFFLAWKLLSTNKGKVSKPKNLSLDKSNIPNLDTFDLIRSFVSAPLSYYVILFGIGLTISIAAILIFGIYYLESSLTQRVHTGILFLIGLGAILGMISGIYSILISFKKKNNFEIAIELTDQNSNIVRLVNEVARKLNTLPPDHILISFTPDFHVHQTSSILLNGAKIKGKTLTIGIIYLKYLYEQEFKSIITHELSHFTGKDTWFSIYIYPTYKSFNTLLANLMSIGQSKKENDNSSGAMALPNLLTFFILIKYYEIFKKLIARMDRQREARADIIASICYGNDAFIKGLTKVSKIGFLFDKVENKDHWEIITKHNKKFINYFDFFDKNYYKDVKVKKALEQYNQSDTITSDFDTHFSLHERFEYLPDDNKISYSKKIILEKEDQDKYEKQLSDLYGEFLGYLWKDYIGQSQQQNQQKTT